MRPATILGALAVACSTGCSRGDSVSDTETCPALGVELAGEWLEADLPARADKAHTEPGAAVGDIDGDGRPDVLVAWGGGSFLLRNDGAGGLVVDELFADGEPLPPASAVALDDLDGDGDLDVWLGRHDGGPDLLLMNDGSGAFTSTEIAGSETPSWTGALGDADGDGDLDLYVASRILDIVPDLVTSGEQDGEPNALYRAQGDGSFLRDDSAVPQEDNHALTFHGAWVDYDLDGDLDIYEANDWGHYIVPNRLLENDGSGVFTEVSDCFCDLEMYGMGVAVGDANGDGLPDLYVTDIGPQAMLFNQGDGTFADAGAASGAALEPTEQALTSWGARFVDFDLDGCDDLLVTHGRLGKDDMGGELDGIDDDWVDGDEQVDVLIRGDCDGGFERVEGLGLDGHGGRGRSLTVGDLDADGRPEMVSLGKWHIRLWKSTGGCEPGVTLRLAGPPGNPHGIGARVEVTISDRTTTHWMLPSTTHGQAALELYLGTGTAGAADRIDVYWPGGGTSTAADVAAGTVLTVSR